MHYRWDFDDEQLDFLRLNWLVLYPDREKEDPDEVMRDVLTPQQAVREGGGAA